MNFHQLTRQLRLSILFCLFLAFSASAQKQTLIGLNVNGELYPGFFWPVVGLTAERQITKHSGGETGLYYQTVLTPGFITQNGPGGSQSHFFIVSQHHLVLPLLYKYYSKILNFSVGPTIDYYLGWRQKDNESLVKIESFNVSPKVKIGFLAKVSKVIPLNQQFILEPEIRFGSVQTLDEAGLGIGLAGKYRF